ncbi:MAG TPA: hypothetical protein PLO06_06930 [Methanoregulaceae archaeon]|nr:hypothetical protein [Methanoregulaceae archaeon]HPD75494.1 hypothetical protein [Methanoregulaceae archaeon]
MSDILDRIEKQGILTPVLREEFLKEYGNRGMRALAAVGERRVKRYLDFTVVESSTREYVVDEDICVCGDSLFRNRECWHILAVRLARATRSFTEDPSWYQELWTVPEG